jgi:hypothetical protein
MGFNSVFKGLRSYPGIFQEGRWKTTKTNGRIDVSKKVRTGLLPNGYRSSKALLFF